MRQTILSVVLDVDPQSARHLSDLIEAFKRQQEEAGVETYGRLKVGVPTWAASSSSSRVSCARSSSARAILDWACFSGRSRRTGISAACEPFISPIGRS